MKNSNLNSINFSKFLERTNASQFTDIHSSEGLHVADSVEFQKMQQHIIKKYEGIDVQHTYVNEAGQIIDCIPIEQQKSFRNSNAKLATPVDLPQFESQSKKPNQTLPQVEPNGDSELLDRYGNKMKCPKGTIPMLRTSLSDMARFESLNDFFQKAPGGGQHPRIKGARALAATHKYAHASQSVNNVGGRSNVNVWQPSINTAASQIFSLSQHWYAGGSGTGLQTVECGWQVYPGKYGNANSNLFIYWTADGYGSTGCYNLDCSAFVQTNPKWVLGGALRPVSTSGGDQYEMFFSYYLYQGNWWLYLQGGKVTDAVGYYPGGIFNNGQLATEAKEIDYGGETVGTTSWPPMGGGAFADQGAKKAAYQRNIYLYPPGSKYYANAKLSESQPSPSCYTIDTSSKGSWDEHFYFGGPGGSSC